jgi:hypothetical protein
MDTTLTCAQIITEMIEETFCGACATRQKIRLSGHKRGFSSRNAMYLIVATTT